MASKPTVAPIAAPAIIPFSFAPVDTFKMTNMSKKVKITSNINDCCHVPEGKLAPKVSLSGNNNFKL